MASDFRKQFSNLKQVNFLTWLMHIMPVGISDVSMQYQEEFSKIQNDESVKILLNLKGVISWLCDET